MTGPSDAALADRRCVPCSGGISALSESAASDLLSRVPGWSLATYGRSLEHEFAWRDFAAAMRFVNSVAAIAEEEGHHPDIHVHWNRVRLVLYTHEIQGLHENDFILAAKISAAAAAHSG